MTANVHFKDSTRPGLALNGVTSIDRDRDTYLIHTRNVDDEGTEWLRCYRILVTDVHYIDTEYIGHRAPDSPLPLMTTETKRATA